MVRSVYIGAVLLAATAGAAGADSRFVVDPEEGRNAFTAIFDSATGERITALSSAVGCTIAVDETARTGHATCSVPLTAIRVDNDDVKSDHFRQWATNNSSDPKRCMIALEVPHVVLPAQGDATEPASVTTTGRFTVCGRDRDDHGAEPIAVTVTVLPAGAYAGNPRRLLRIRARIEGFARERYGIGPRFTSGWLARVQQLAPVVATDGTIDVNLFAVEVAP